MKKLMENWRSYEKEVLSELESPYAHMEQPLSPITGDPMVYGAGIEDAARAAADTASDTASVLAELYDDYIQDPFSNTVHKMTGPLQDALEPLIRYGLPSADWLRKLTEEELEVAGLTREEAEDIARLEYTDFIFDPEDPIDVASEIVAGASTAAGGTMASTGVGAAPGAAVVVGGISLAAIGLVLGRLNKLRKIPGWVSDVAKIRRLKKLKGAYEALKVSNKAGLRFMLKPNKKTGVVEAVGYKIGDISIAAEKIAKVAPDVADLAKTGRKAIPFTPQPGGAVQYLIFRADDYDKIIQAAPEVKHLAKLTDPGTIERVTAGIATGEISLKALAKSTATTVVRAPGKAAQGIADYCASGIMKGGLCIAADVAATAYAVYDTSDRKADMELAQQEYEDIVAARNPPLDPNTPIVTRPSPPGTEVDVFKPEPIWDDNAPCDENCGDEGQEQLGAYRPPNRSDAGYDADYDWENPDDSDNWNVVRIEEPEPIEERERREDIIREEIVKYFSNRR